MAVSANYATPVYVNGYQCNNCTQVAEAKKDINPADPKAGPGGIDASSASQSPAFTLGGSLAKGGVCDGAVIAFEPLPDIFLKLRSNITSQNACLVNAALSDQSGRTSFVHARGTPWESGLRQRILTDPQHADPVTIEVEAMRLDDWIEDMTALRYIKIDVEGGEMAVLQGAERTLGRFRPIISVEYGFQGYSVYGHEKRTLWDFAAAHDYILGDLFGAPCYSVDTWNLVCGRSYWDYYIVPRERTEEWQAAVSGSTPQ